MSEEKKIDIKEEFVSLDQIMQRAQKPAEKILSAEDLLNKSFVIFRITFYQGEFGDYAYVETDQGWLRTSSKILLKQLKLIDKAMEERKLKGVRVTLVKRKSANKRSYYCFE
jgi:hypothetical protein